MSTREISHGSPRLAVPSLRKSRACVLASVLVAIGVCGACGSSNEPAGGGVSDGGSHGNVAEGGASGGGADSAKDTAASDVSPPPEEAGSPDEASNAGSDDAGVDAPPSITLAPMTVTVLVGTSQQFTATVANLASSTVSWSILEDAGAITEAGVYTSPSTPGTAHIVAS